MYWILYIQYNNKILVGGLNIVYLTKSAMCMCLNCTLLHNTQVTNTGALDPSSEAQSSWTTRRSATALHNTLVILHLFFYNKQFTNRYRYRYNSQQYIRYGSMKDRVYARLHSMFDWHLTMDLFERSMIAPLPLFCTHITITITITITSRCYIIDSRLDQW